MCPKRKRSPGCTPGVVDLTISPTQDLPLPPPSTTRDLRSRISSRASSRSLSNHSRHSPAPSTTNAFVSNTSEAGPSSGGGSKRRKVELSTVGHDEKWKGKAREVDVDGEVDVDEEVDELDSESEHEAKNSSHAAEKGKAREVHVEEEIDELNSEVDELEWDSGEHSGVPRGYNISSISVKNGKNHDTVIRPSIAESAPSSSRALPSYRPPDILWPNATPRFDAPHPSTSTLIQSETQTSSSPRVVQPSTPRQSPKVTTLQTPPQPAQPEPLSSYTCPICFFPPTNATLTPCGHICCGQCLFTAVKTTMTRGMWVGEGSAKCPVCRAVIPGWDGRGGGVIGLKARVVFTLA